MNIEVEKVILVFVLIIFFMEAFKLYKIGVFQNFFSSPQNVEPKKKAVKKTATKAVIKKTNKKI